MARVKRYADGKILARLTAGNGAEDDKGFRPRCDRIGKRGIRRLMREILLAGEEPQERPALLGDLIADRPAQHRIAGFKRVEDGALRGWTPDVEFDLAANLRQGSQMVRKDNSDHIAVILSV